LENGPTFDQLAAQGQCVGDVAVVGNGRTAHGKLAKERLHIADRGLLAFVARCGIAHMANPDTAG